MVVLRLAPSRALTTTDNHGDIATDNGYDALYQCARVTPHGTVSCGPTSLWCSPMKGSARGTDTVSFTWRRDDRLTQMRVHRAPREHDRFTGISGLDTVDHSAG